MDLLSSVEQGCVEVYSQSQRSAANQKVPWAGTRLSVAWTPTSLSSHMLSGGVTRNHDKVTQDNLPNL